MLMLIQYLLNKNPTHIINMYGKYELLCFYVYFNVPAFAALIISGLAYMYTSTRRF